MPDYNTVPKLNILVVDDSIIARNKIIKILGREDYNILESGNGFEALNEIKNSSIDCIFLDLLMPEMDGFEFLQKYNEEGIKTPVVVISADVQDLTKLKCYELGVIRFLNKPPTKEELFSALNDAIKLRN